MRADTHTSAVGISPVAAALWGERAERAAAIKDALRQETLRRMLAGREAEFLSQLTREINSSKHFGPAFHSALARICEWTGWAAGAAWVPGNEQTGLVLHAVWHPRTGGYRKVFARNRSIGVGASEGLPGQVWNQRVTVWLNDLSLEDRSAWGQQAAARFRSAVGLPVVAGDEIYAALVFFNHEPRSADRRLAQVVEVAGMQLGGLIRIQRLDEALQRRERQLTATQRLARLGGWEWELTGDRFRFSTQLLSVLRLEPVAAVGRLGDFLRRVHADDRPTVRARMWQALRDRKSFGIEHRMVCGDGLVRLVRSQGEVIVEKGKPCRVTGLCQELTRLKRFEAGTLEVEESDRKRRRIRAESRARRIRRAAVLDLGMPGRAR